MATEQGLSGSVLSDLQEKLKQAAFNFDWATFLSILQAIILALQGQKKFSAAPGSKAAGSAVAGMDCADLQAALGFNMQSAAKIVEHMHNCQK